MTLLQATVPVVAQHGGIVFDGTINLGNILTIVFGGAIWMITLAVAWTKFGGRMDMLEFRVDLLEKTLEGIKSILEKFVAQETELKLIKAAQVAQQLEIANLQRTIEGLRRGKGFINDGTRNGLAEEEY